MSSQLVTNQLQDSSYSQQNLIISRAPRMSIRTTFSGFHHTLFVVVFSSSSQEETLKPCEYQKFNNGNFLTVYVTNIQRIIFWVSFTLNQFHRVSEILFTTYLKLHTFIKTSRIFSFGTSKLYKIFYLLSLRSKHTSLERFDDSPLSLFEQLFYFELTSCSTNRNKSLRDFL